MNCLVVGASAGVGRSLAELLCEKGHNVFLIASDAKDLDPLVRDLSLRFSVRVGGAAVDLRSPPPQELREKVTQAIGKLDNLFIVAGAFDAGDFFPMAPSLVDQLIHVNFGGPVHLINLFYEDLLSAKGNVVGIGSVAAIRGRGRAQVYASCKRGLEFLFQTLRHSLAASPCRVQFYRLGYVKTSMTFGQKLLFPPVDPRYVAEIIYRGLGRDIDVKYIPVWWQMIAMVLKCLPWTVFKKLKF